MSNQTPLAFDLSAIEEEKVEDHKQNAATIFNAINKVREIGDGYSFRLPAKTNLIRKAGAFIARERLCSPFFEFGITVQPDQQPVWLTGYAKCIFFAMARIMSIRNAARTDRIPPDELLNDLETAISNVQDSTNYQITNNQ